MGTDRFLGIADEVTWGTFATSGWKRLGITSCSVALNRDSYKSKLIIGKRGLVNVRAGNDNVSGQIAGELLVSGMEPIWYYALGGIYVDGATPVDTTGQTRASAAKGATVIPVQDAVVGASGVVVGAYVRIGTIANKDTFVRKIVSIVNTTGSATLTVDYPIPRAVAALEPVFTVSSPFTKTYTRGILPTGFSLETNFQDINQYFQYAGCKMANLNITIPKTGLVTWTADVRGQSSTLSSTSTAGNLPLPSLVPFTSWEGAMLEGGVGGSKVTNFTIKIDNQLSDSDYGVGTRQRLVLPEQQGEITGSFTVFFEDATIANKARNETPTSIELTFTNTTTGYSTDILFPLVKYTGGALDPKLQAAFGPLTLDNMPLQILVDPVTGTDIKVTVANDNHLGW